MLRLALCGLVVAIAMIGGIAQAATIQYVYDELGRLVAQVDSSGEVTVYTYDAAGNLVSVSRDTNTQIALIAFAPSRGQVGDEVTLYGFGFLPVPAQNAVSFNGTPAAVLSATANVIVAQVPAGTASGPIMVANANGTAVSAQPFTLATPPLIASATPNQVARGATTRIDIAGAHLESTRAVSFEQAGFAASIIPGATDALVSVNLRVAGSVPLGTYAFTVTNDDGSTSSGSVTIGVSTALLGDVTTVTRPFSLYLPNAVTGVVPGNALLPSRTLSVHLPAAVPGVLPGNAINASQPLSVSMP